MLRERADGRRASRRRGTVTKLIALGAGVYRAGAGELARFPDADLCQKAGASASTPPPRPSRAPISVWASPVRQPAWRIRRRIGDRRRIPTATKAEIAALAKAGVTAVAMEFMPRITRAQSDGYRTSRVVSPALPGGDRCGTAFDHAMPCVALCAPAPAKVFVVGPCVPGLRRQLRKAPGCGGHGHRRARRSGRAGGIAGRQVRHDRALKVLEA